MDKLLTKAWEVRAANFPMEITSVCPSRTQGISVTGKVCALNCAHCGGHYLGGMYSLEAALEKNSRTVSPSYLISGGSTLEGKVPLIEHIEGLRQLGKFARLNVHPGLVNASEAEALAQVAQVASFDFVANREIIRDVYGLDKDISDYLNSYRFLAEAFGIHRVVPHVTLGLARGQLSNEVEAVKLLSREEISRLVLLVFRPTSGTRFAHVAPPPVSEVVAALAQIRIALPSVPLYLGCMRPGGSYRLLLDSLAPLCGLNKIVQPASCFQPEAEALGLKILYEEECCAL